MKNEWKDEYYRMMQKEFFSEDEKENMTQRLMQNITDDKAVSKTKNKNAVKKHFKIIPGIKTTAAACFVCILLITGATAANAAGLLKPVPDLFAKVFKLAEDDMTLADEMWKSLGQSAVSNHIRVTADAVIADSYAYAVIFSIKREDGKPLDTEGETTPDSWDFHSIETEGVDSIWTEYYSYDETPSDSTVQYVMIASCGHEIKADDNLSVSFADLYHMDKNGNKDYTVNGNWQLELSFPKLTDQIVDTGAKKTLRLEETAFTVDRIRISPLSYHLVLSVKKDSRLNISDSAKLLDRCVMELELKSGEKIPFGDGGNAVKDKGNRVQFIYGDTFQTLVHVEDIKAIHIGELRIPSEYDSGVRGDFAQQCFLLNSRHYVMHSINSVIRSK